MDARNQGITHNVEQTEIITFITSETAFRQKCQRGGFWYRHIRFCFLGPSQFYQIASRAQLCGIGTRVS